MGGDHSDQPGLLPGVSNKKKQLDQNVVGAFALNSPKEQGLFKYEPIPAAELARAEAVPDMTAGLGYRWFNETDDSALVAGVSIPLPVFDRRQGDVLAARFGVASARNQQRAVELRIEAAIASAYARLANAYLHESEDSRRPSRIHWGREPAP